MFVPKSVNFKISFQKKIEGKYCCAHHCKNKPNEKKCGLCHKHYQRYRRMIDPVFDRYVNFKGNAKRRQKEFTITLDQFRGFCNKTGYIITKGMRGRTCTIDRINNNEGYHIDNIQILSMSKNIEKYHIEDKKCPF